MHLHTYLVKSQSMCKMYYTCLSLFEEFTEFNYDRLKLNHIYFSALGINVLPAR
jgi:hypothetical protein